MRGQSTLGRAGQGSQGGTGTRMNANARHLDTADAKVTEITLKRKLLAVHNVKILASFVIRTAVCIYELAPSL